MSKIVILGTAHPHIFGMTESAKKARGAQLLGVWDDDAGRLEKAAKQMSLPAIKSLDEALAMKPELVITAAVPCDRAGIAERALAAGAAVMVDKPLALTRAELDRVRGAVERHRRPLTVYYPYRGYPQVLAAKEAIDAGWIGKLVRVFSCGPHKINAPTRPAWHWTRAGNGGILIDIGSHHIDLCCWVAGGEPEAVTALHGNFDQPAHPEFRDFGQAQMRFPGGALAHVEVDWLNPPMMKNFGDTRMWFQGTAGKIELRLGDEVTAQIWSGDQAGAPLDHSKFPPEEQWYIRALEDLAAGKPGPIPPEEVWRTSRVTLAADASAEAGGKPVRV